MKWLSLIFAVLLYSAPAYLTAQVTTDTAFTFALPRIPLEGFVQGGFINFGKGKVAIFGEAAMFTAQLIDQTPVGINAPEAKYNAYLLLNVFHWLATPTGKSKSAWLDQVELQHIFLRSKK